MIVVHRWRPGDPAGVPRRGQVDVWIVVPDGVVRDSRATECLAPAEVERARRFRFDADRRRFLGSRVALRHIIAGCLLIPAREVAFRTGPFGKPHLDPERHGTEMRFNLSHSGDLALIAVSRDAEVGVDAELRRPRPDLEALAARYFSPSERAAIAALASERSRLDAFFDYWTLKEAYLKACGDGLNRRLDAFDVVFDHDRRPRLGEVRDRPGDEHRWTLTPLVPVTGYAAAVAVAAPRPHPRVP